MKKSILIGVLAALMLFAFTACDNNPQVEFANPVVELYTESVPTVLENQKPAETAYVIMGRYYDGTTFQVPASDYEIKFNSTAAPSTVDSETKEFKPVDVGTVTYTAYNYEKEATGTLTAVVYDVKALTVSGPSDPQRYYAGATDEGKMIGDEAATLDALFNKTPYTVNAVYENAEGEDVTQALTADQYVVDYKSGSGSTAGAATVEFKPSLAKAGTADSFTQDTEYTGKNEFGVILEKDSVESIAFEPLATPVTLVKGEKSAAINAKGMSTYGKVTATYVSGVTEDVTETATGAWTSGIDGTQKFNADTATLEIAVGTDKTTAIFTISEPSVTAFTATAPATVKAGEKFKISDVTISVTSWTKDVEPSDADTVFADGANFTVEGQSGADYEFTIPATAEAGDEYYYVVKLTKYSSADLYAVMTLTVADAQ